MTASPSEAAAPLPTSSGRTPDFFIVGHPKCGTTALYEMLRTPSADLHAGAQGARFLRRHAPARRPARSPELVRSTLEEYLAPVRRRGPAAERVGDILAVPVVARRRRPRTSLRLQPQRAHHRDPARARELPALAASADAAEHIETEQDLRKALDLEPRQARRAGRSRAVALAAALAVFRACALCRAAAQYHEALSARSRCWC